MASQRQLEANRHNGQKGGPKTEAGKQVSRHNAIKHGLTSATLVVLPEEHQHEYQAVLQGFRDSFQPQDPAEEALVLRLAQAHWRSLRSRRVETTILSLTADTERARAKKTVENCPEHLNPHNAIAVGFMTNPAERWQMYLRYDTTISREFFRTLDALTRLQNTRNRNKRPLEKVLVATAGASPALSDSGIRSVLQNGPSASEPAAVSPQASEGSILQVELAPSYRTDRLAFRPHEPTVAGDKMRCSYLAASGLEGGAFRVET